MSQSLTSDKQKEKQFLIDKIREGRSKSGMGSHDPNIGKWMARLKELSRSKGTEKLFKMSEKTTRSSFMNELRLRTSASKKTNKSKMK